MRVVDLRQKEVINICTCKTLGCPIDVEFLSLIHISEPTRH